MIIRLPVQRRPVVLAIRPVDEVCNLSCTYCNAAVYNLRKPRLPVPVLERLINQASDLNYAQVQFVWHGGEPLVVGADYFGKIVALQEEAFGRGESNSIYENVVQTNGLLLGNRFLDLFERFGFWIGVSLDGPDVECNYYRFPAGKAEFLLEKTMATITQVVNRGLSVLVIGVVHDRNALRAREMYDFYRSLGVSKVSFNPRYLRGGGDQNTDPEVFLMFLEDLLDAREEAVRRGEKPLAIGILDDLERVRRGESPQMCFFSGSCHKFFSVNSSGDVYATCTDALGVHLGNLANFSLDDIVERFSSSPIPAVSKQLGGNSSSELHAIGPGCPKYSEGQGDEYLHVYRRLLARRVGL